METRAWCIINKTLSGSLINNRLICKGINLNTSRHGGLRSVLGDQLHKNPRRINFKDTQYAGLKPSSA